MQIWGVFFEGSRGLAHEVTSLKWRDLPLFQEHLVILYRSNILTWKIEPHEEFIDAKRSFSIMYQ
jgi:hypothetical protein